MLSRERLIKLMHSKAGVFLILLGPIEFLIFFITLFPLVFEIWLSFTRWNPIMGDWFSAPFIGGINYLELLTTDVRFLMSLARTGLIAGIVLVSEIFIGLGLAVFVRNVPGKKVLFSILILPMMVMPVVVGFNFRMLFEATGPINGVISGILEKTFELVWLGHPTTAIPAIIITDIWHWTSLMFLIMYAGLSALPENPIRAAKVLGASSWEIFWNIKIPLMTKIILLAAIIRSLDVLKLFDEIFIMTGGGPGTSTETLSLWIFNQGLLYGNMGYASAAAMIVLLITAFFIIIIGRPVLRRE